jgi:hypothetical protein
MRARLTTRRQVLAFLSELLSENLRGGGKGEAKRGADRSILPNSPEIQAIEARRQRRKGATELFSLFFLSIPDCFSGSFSMS